MQDISDQPSLLQGADVGHSFIDPTLFSAPSAQTRAKHRRPRRSYNTQGLVEVGSFGGYRSHHPDGNTDPWVREALKQFKNGEIHDSIPGFTRRGEGLPGMYKSLKKYEGDLFSFSDLNSQQRLAMRHAIGKARVAFRTSQKRQPFRPYQVGHHLKTDTSAGYTFPGLKKRDCMPEILDEARWLAHRIKREGKESFNPKHVRFPPCMAGSRGHISPEDDVKTRLVWVYPAEMLVIEGLFAPIIYDSLATQPDGPLMVGKSSQRLFTEWLVNWKEGEKLHGIDFKAFDTHVPQWLIHVSFDILKQNIDWEYDGTTPHSAAGRRKLANLWRAVKWYFIHTPIIMPDGHVFRKHHGVPSGSYFTQLIDSVVNYILVSYVCEMQDVEVRNLKVLGDDSKFRSPSSLDLDKAQVDCDACAMHLSVEKCEIEEDPTMFKSLGTTYRNGHAWREDSEWFKFALYPENIPPDVQTSMTRLVGLWLAGAMHSKLFVEFFDFYQSCYPMPSHGMFSKDQRRWLEIVHGGKAPSGWSGKQSLFWRSIFFTL